MFADWAMMSVAIAQFSGVHAVAAARPKPPEFCRPCGAGIEPWRFDCSYCRTPYPASYRLP